MANSEGPRRRDTCALLAFSVLVALIVLSPVYLACHPRDLWLLHYHGAARALGLGLVVHAVVAVALAGRRPRWLLWAVLAGSTFLLGCAITVQPLGDHGLWPAFAQSDTVAASSLLSSWLVWLAFEVHPTFADHLSPALGAAFLLAWGQPDTVIPSWPAPWFRQLPEYDETLTFQGIIEDAGGVRRATNAVVVVPSATR